MTLMKWSRKWTKVISHFSDIFLCTNAPRNFDRCKDVPSYKIGYRVRIMIAIPKGKIGNKARWIYYITLPSQKYFIVLERNRSFALTAYHFCTRFVVSVPMRAFEQFVLPKQNLVSSLIFWRQLSLQVTISNEPDVRSRATFSKCARNCIIDVRQKPQFKMAQDTILVYFVQMRLELGIVATEPPSFKIP